jgi:ATP-dependent helicase YprA (DUF1998 family)
MLGSLYDEAVRSRPESFAQPGVRALILYPMNALVNDQLAACACCSASPPWPPPSRGSVQVAAVPRFGMYTGRTPYPGPAHARPATASVSSRCSSTTSG